MAGRSTQAMAAPAVRPERHDTPECTVWGFFMRRRIPDRGFSPRSSGMGRIGSWPFWPRPQSGYL